MNDVLDLATLRAERVARGERAEPKSFKVGDKTYELPPLVPPMYFAHERRITDAARAARDAKPGEVTIPWDEFEAMTRCLFGDATTEVVHSLDFDDLAGIVAALYGEKNMGETDASPSSSKSAARRSKSTSGRTTGSTSKT